MRHIISHRCIGLDGAEKPSRIGAELLRMDPDVTALQEVALKENLQDDMFANLAWSLNAKVIEGPTMKEQSGRYGNAVLSRFASARVDRLDISVPGREPRGALGLTLFLNGQTVRVVACHLGLFPGERRRQIRRLLPLLDKSAATVKILLGDFNEWFFWGRPLRWINRRLGAMPYRRPSQATVHCWPYAESGSGLPTVCFRCDATGTRPQLSLPTTFPLSPI